MFSPISTPDEWDAFDKKVKCRSYVDTKQIVSMKIDFHGTCSPCQVLLLYQQLLEHATRHTLFISFVAKVYWGKK
jgi:hypothetical protein